jgi:arylsulfatase A-like enzyme
VKRWDRTAFFVDRTLDFLKRHTNQPCYVNLWPDDTHTPYVPRPALKEKFKAGYDANSEANFKGVLEEYDRQMGRLLDGLKQLGIATNTLVVFTGDNGPLPTYQQKRTAGLRGSKLSLYEGGTRLPLIAWWPGATPAGRVNERTVMNAVDLLPTFCKLAGAPVSPDITTKFDGEDLSAAFTGAEPKRSRPQFWEYGRNNDSFKYPAATGHRSPNVAVREGDWKLLVNADGSDAQLFDLGTDIFETRNVAEANPQISARLKQQALAWRKELP